MAEEHIQEQTKKRRTFAIISHPDAGKTTLTEKFLLYSGQVAEAGSLPADAREARQRGVGDSRLRGYGGSDGTEGREKGRLFGGLVLRALFRQG